MGLRRVLDQDEANKASGSVKVFDIGQPAVQMDRQDRPRARSDRRLDRTGVDVPGAVEDGKFGGETIYGTLQNGVLSAGKMSDLIPADVQAKYLDYIDQMTKDTFMK